MRLHAQLLTFVVVGCIASTIAWASPTPLKLRDKTIAVSWTVGRTIINPRGKTREISFTISRLIYVSSAGRFFVRVSANGHSVERAPGDRTPTGGLRNVTFQNRRIIGMNQQGTGAGRMIIDFDNDYRTCSVNVTFGKPQTGHVTLRNRAGREIEILNETHANKKCSISDGNQLSR